MENQNLYDWVFRFNPMNDTWYAAKREHYSDLFSDTKSKHLLKSSSISTLMEIINRTDGDEKAIQSILNIL